jgi:hypothetical protein
MIRAIGTKTVTQRLVRFAPDDHPWHRSIQLNTIDGKIPTGEPHYSCIIPVGQCTVIFPGDWIMVDDMDNAIGVLHANTGFMAGWSIKEV